MKTRCSPCDNYVVIMAGGRGERFWPLSREKTPKQLLTLIGNRSFLQQAVDRVTAIVPPSNVFVITNNTQLAAVRKQLPNLPRKNLVAEPCGRDTCAAVALGAALVGHRAPLGVMAVLPADHLIPEPDKFRQVLRDAFDLARQHPVLVTIGIKPTEPATGYGYIHAGQRYKHQSGSTRFFVAKRFVEKPPLATAIKYFKNDAYRWNAGMFIWSFPAILETLTIHQPNLAKRCNQWRAIADSPRLAAALAKDYLLLNKISVDYALMEKARNVVVADGAFSWDDLGSWAALMRHLPSDPERNCAVGNLVHIDSTANLVFDARTKHRNLTTLVGVSNAVVVLTDDATMIAHRDRSQDIKELVRKLASLKKFEKLI
jgi:mannose-1-phosphate guanylyltransferase